MALCEQCNGVSQVLNNLEEGCHIKETSRKGCIVQKTLSYIKALSTCCLHRFSGRLYSRY